MAVLIVRHDLNLAVAYADTLTAVVGGRVAALRHRREFQPLSASRASGA